MISPVLQTFIEKLAADGCVSQAEVLEVRRLVYADGQVSRAEADLLFTLNERVANDDPAWGDMFAEAVCDHLTQTGEPEGHVTEEAASWLERAIGHDAVLERETELAVVLKVLERAQSVPQRLADFARALVSRAVLTGEGYVGRDDKLVPGQIGDVELALIKRALYACGGAGDVFVTRAEAEWLFDLDAATEGRAHCAGWRDVFVNALMNHLFAAGPSDMLGRAAMIDRAKWMNGKSAGVAGFYGRLFKGKFAANLMQANEWDGAQKHANERALRGDMAQALDVGEAAWLVTRINDDKRKTENERALIAAVKAAKGEDALKSA